LLSNLLAFDKMITCAFFSPHKNKVRAGLVRAGLVRATPRVGAVCLAVVVALPCRKVGEEGGG
jgi:hypothetical protein